MLRRMIGGFLIMYGIMLGGLYLVNHLNIELPTFGYNLVEIPGLLGQAIACFVIGVLFCVWGSKKRIKKAKEKKEAKRLEQVNQSEARKVTADNYNKVKENPAKSSLSGSVEKDWTSLTAQIQLTSDAKTKSLVNNLIYFFGMCMFAPAILASTVSNIITIIFGQQMFVYVLVILVIGTINFILFFKNVKINKIRQYCFSYLQDLENKHSAQNDKNVCPRCGGHLQTCTKKEYYKVRVGDKVRYGVDSSGNREEISREGIYESRSRIKTYYVCTNSECRLAFNDELPEYTELPQNKRQAIAMMTGDHSYCKEERVYAAKSFGTMTTVNYIIITIICMIAFVVCSLGYSKVQDIKYGFASEQMSGTDVATIINNLETISEYKVVGHAHPNNVVKGLFGPYAEANAVVKGKDKVVNGKYFYIDGVYYYALSTDDDDPIVYKYEDKYPANMKDEFGVLETAKFNLVATLKRVVNDGKSEVKGYEGKDGCYKIIVKDSVSLETYIFYIKDEKVIYYEDEDSVNYIEYTDVTIELPTLEFTEDPYY